jgi:hypothetical protein
MQVQTVCCQARTATSVFRGSKHGVCSAKLEQSRPEVHGVQKVRGSTPLASCSLTEDDYMSPHLSSQCFCNLYNLKTSLFNTVEDGRSGEPPPSLFPALPLDDSERAAWLSVAEIKRKRFNNYIFIEAKHAFL